jgi:hypothetical protein
MDVDAQHPAEAIPSNPATAPATATPAGSGGGDERRGGKGPDRRKSGIDRRSGLERRQQTAAESGYTGEERRSGADRRDGTGLERRRGPGRRRSDDRRSAEEGEMTGHQFEFVMAIETYKKVNKRMYPTWTEILEIIRQLGYRKVHNRTISLNAPEPELLRFDENGEPDDE